MLEASDLPLTAAQVVIEAEEGTGRFEQRIELWRAYEALRRLQDQGRVEMVEEGFWQTK